MIPRLDQAALMPDVFPRLYANGLVLREIAAVDARSWHAYLSDVETIEWTSTPFMEESDVAATIEYFREAFLDKRAIRWALAEGPDGVMIGDCGYNSFNSRDGRGEIGYQLSKGLWGQGIMTRAVGAIVDYGFQTLELNKVEATVSVGNERSAGLLRKLGFKVEGTLRDYRNRRGVLGDSWYFGLLRREWEGAAGR